MTNLNTANKITIFRIILVPVIISLSVTTRVEDNLYNIINVVLIIIFGIGDGLDGYISRKYNQETKLGTFLDPFADKLMVLSVCAVLTIYNKIPLWYFLLIYIKDIMVFMMWLAFYCLTKDMRIKPNIFGKTSTVFHLAVMLMAYLLSQSTLYHYVLILSAIITSCAGLTYIYEGLKYYFGIRRHNA